MLIALAKDRKLDTPLLTIRFNWAEVLFYGFFLAYGYYGAAAPAYATLLEHDIIGIISLIFVSFLLVALGLIAWKWGEAFKDHVDISRRDLIIIFALIALMFSLAYKSLNNSIQGDELAYSMMAHGHAIMLLLKLPDSLSALTSIPFKYLVQFVSLVIVGILFTFIFVSRKLPWPFRIALVLGALLFCRLIIVFLGGNPSPHPPLGGIALLVSGSLFGISDFSLKLSFYSAFILFIFGIYKILSQIIDWRLSFLFALAVGTIPLLQHLASIIENSLWSSICFTLVMMELVVNKTPNFVRLASFVSIVTLMRQPTFVGYIPILIIAVAYLLKSPYEDRLKKLFFIVAPSIIFIPFLTQSLLFGTPSTASLGAETGILLKLFHSIDSGIVFVAIANSVPIWWIVFIPFAFTFLDGNRVRSASFAAFFVVTLAMYYSIIPLLHGLAKYQAEYAIPFAIVGASLILIQVIKMHATKTYIAILVILTGLNVTEYLRIPYGNKPADISVDTWASDSKEFNAGYRVLCGANYDYKSAFNEVAKQDMTNNSYFAGASYGVLTQIINGYSFAATKQANNIYLNQQKLNKETGVAWVSTSVDNIESDPRIKMVVLGAIPQRDQLLESFIKRGWIIHSKHTNAEYGSSVITIIKPV